MRCWCASLVADPTLPRSGRAVTCGSSGGARRLDPVIRWLYDAGRFSQVAEHTLKSPIAFTWPSVIGPRRQGSMCQKVKDHQ